ncbi:DUF1414 domain-containing protein [Echinimonas agarilytica]|uniref:UPF0352 protein NAF29_09190 n=1 Tax=Echinimonas agarilytica TaxID=1215918 RepID=A0AA42B7L5_9GAMM|nr:DUF1414 domain-containing protein [Echinimonas agarilytica]MCM2679837.1 DUF1414 domain-containing protein [Echinimonas agarilytica]
MPIQSKYTTEHVEELMSEIQHVFLKHESPVDLQLMVLGNTVSQLLMERVSANQRAGIAEQFGQVLQRAVNESH